MSLWATSWQHWVCDGLRTKGEWVAIPESEMELENSDTCKLAGSPRLFAKIMDVAALQERFDKTGEKWATSLRSFANEVLFYRGLERATEEVRA